MRALAVDAYLAFQAVEPKTFDRFSDHLRMATLGVSVVIERSDRCTFHGQRQRAEKALKIWVAIEWRSEGDPHLGQKHRRGQF